MFESFLLCCSITKASPTPLPLLFSNCETFYSTLMCTVIWVQLYYRKIQEESLRTYLFTYNQVYDSLRSVPIVFDFISIPYYLPTTFVIWKLQSDHPTGQVRNCFIVHNPPHFTWFSIQCGCFLRKSQLICQSTASEPRAAGKCTLNN